MNQTALESFVEDASGYRGEAEQVFTPATVEEVQEIVRSAVEQNIP